MNVLLEMLVQLWIRSIKPYFSEGQGIKQRLHKDFKIPLVELGDD